MAEEIKYIAACIVGGALGGVIYYFANEIFLDFFINK